MLSGNLELFALADVLRFVARSGATGVVNIYRPSDGGRLLLVDGEVVGASLDGLDMTDEDGVVDAGLRLIDGGAGDFALDIEQVSGPTRQPVEEFLKAVTRRRAEWTKILGVIGSLDDALRLSAALPQGASEITLNPLEWQIAVLADGRRSLREIAQEVGESDFAASRALLAMANAGLLGFGDGAVVFTPEEADDEEIEDEAPEEPEAEDDVEFAYGETPEEDSPTVDEPATRREPEPDADLDPAELLRELGGQRPLAARGRRSSHAGRDEQRLRMRSR